MHRYPHLTANEIKILTLIAEGKQPQGIMRTLGLMSTGKLSEHCQRIKDKTGIGSMADSVEVLAYISVLRPRLITPSKRQMEVLRLMANGQSFEDIRKTLGVRTKHEVYNHAKFGCRRLGIPKWARGQYRRQLIREALHAEPLPADPMDDPMF